MIGMKVLSSMWLVMLASSVPRNSDESPIRGGPKTKRIDVDADAGVATSPVRTRSVAADGGIKVSDGLVDSTPVESPIRDVKEGNSVEVEADGDIQVSSGHKKMSAKLQKRAEAAQPNSLKQVAMSDEAARALAKINAALKNQSTEEMDPEQVAYLTRNTLEVLFAAAEILNEAKEIKPDLRQYKLDLVQLAIKCEGWNNSIGPNESAEACELIPAFIANRSIAFANSVDPMEENLKVINNGIWNVIITLVPDESQNDSQAIRQVWDQQFEDFFSTTYQVRVYFELYQETGNVTVFGEAMKTLFNYSTVAVSELMNHSVLAAKMEAAYTLVAGYVDSWVKRENGDATGAVEAAWEATVDTVDVLFPNLANNDLYQLIAKGLDPTMSRLNEIVANFSSMKKASSICYKLRVKSLHKVPKYCPEGYTLEGLHCKPEVDAGADCYKPCGGDGWCHHICGVGKACCQKDKEGAACECQSASGYTWREGQVGYAHEYHQCVSAGPYIDNPAYSSSDSLKNRDESIEESRWFLSRRRRTGAPTTPAPTQPRCILNAAAEASADAMFDKAVSPKGKDDDEDPKWGTIPAKCDGSVIYPDGSSNYSWECGGKCYQECPEGFERERGCGGCRQPCGQPFPYFDDMALTDKMCSKRPGELQAWAINMLVDAFASGAELYNQVFADANKSGEKLAFDYTDLQATIDTLVDFAKHYAHGDCPNSATWTAEPTPEPPTPEPPTAEPYQPS